MTHYRRTLVTLVVSKAVLYFILLIVIFVIVKICINNIFSKFFCSSDKNDLICIFVIMDKNVS